MPVNIETIAALLRKAESTEFPDEAEALIAKAQQLASITAIDIELARSHTPAHERTESPITRRIVMGERGKKGLWTYVELFLAIGKVNDVRCTISPSSTYVNAFGFPSDIDMTEQLFTSLVVQMVEASNAYVKQGSFKQDIEWRSKKIKTRWGYDYVEDYFPVDARTARISFQNGYANRIGQRLWGARGDAIKIQEAAQNELTTGGPTSVALVLRNKQDEVAAFYARTSNARGSWGGGSGNNHHAGSSSAGRSAANNARLSSPRGLSGGSRSLPK